MKTEEAIDKIKWRIDTASLIAGKGADGKAFEDLELAIKALEKKIPKKVHIPKWSAAICPSCEMELSEDCGDGYYRHAKYLEVCPNAECCQRLDWSEEE